MKQVSLEMVDCELDVPIRPDYLPIQHYIFCLLV